MDWIREFFSSPPAKQPEILKAAMAAGFELEERLQRAMQFLFSMGQGGFSADSTDYSKIIETKEIWFRQVEIPMTDPAWDGNEELLWLGLAVARMRGQEKYGYINARGKWVIKPQFEYAYQFE